MNKVKQHQIVRVLCFSAFSMLLFAVATQIHAAQEEPGTDSSTKSQTIPSPSDEMATGNQSYPSAAESQAQGSLEDLDWQKVGSVALDYAKSLWGFLREVIPFLAAVAAVLWGFFMWCLKNFSDRWYSIMEFLHDNPEFMDKSKNDNYPASYSDPTERWKYESVARICIAYVDDVYFTRFFRGFFRHWLCGTIPLLVGRHQKWFKDNRDCYDSGFVDFVTPYLDK